MGSRFQRGPTPPLSGGGQPFLKIGLPMMILLVAASFGLKEFQSLRIAMRDEKTHKLSAEEIEELTKTKKRQSAGFDLEMELRRMKEQHDINNWEQKRLPRPGESTKDL